MFGRSPVAWLAVVSLAFLLGACDESEQDRILLYKKGTYLGKPDAPLTEEQVDELRQRATLQGAG